MSETTETNGHVQRCYYRGKHTYHSRQSCAGSNNADGPVSLITLSRTDFSPCAKCDPPELPTEYAVCLECGWEFPVDGCERERGYEGACPACGSAKTTSEFRSGD